MILNRQLTDAERKKSQKNFNRFSLVNGISYMCLGESIVQLLSMKLNMPTELVAILSSTIFLGYLLMPLGVIRTAKVGAAISQADFWVMRNLAALLIAASVLVYNFSKEAAWSMIILGAFIFYGCRAAGCVLSAPLAGDISTESEVAPLISKNNGLFYSTATVTIIIVAIILKMNTGVNTIAWIIVFGACVGITASTFARAVDETGAILKAARQKMTDGMRFILFNKDARHLVYAHFTLVVGSTTLMQLALPTLKRGYNVGDTEALILSSLRLFAAALFASVGGKLCNVVGPKFLIRFGYSIYFIVLAIWIFFPAVTMGADGIANLSITHYALVTAIFLMLGAVEIFCSSSVSSYFLLLCPDKNKQVSGIITENFIATFSAGIIGAIFTSGILRLSDVLNESCGGFFAGADGRFRLYYVMMIPFVIIGVIIISRMRVLFFEYKNHHGTAAYLRVIRIAQTHHRHALHR